MTEPLIHYSEQNVVAAAVAWYRAGQSDSAEAVRLIHAVRAFLDATEEAAARTYSPLQAGMLDVLGAWEAEAALEGADSPHVVVTYDTDPCTWKAHGPTGIPVPSVTVVGPYPDVVAATVAAAEADAGTNTGDDPYPYLSIPARLHSTEVPTP